MHAGISIQATAKDELYAALARQAEALLSGEHDLVANAANFAALVWQHLPRISWCGFYFLQSDGDLLVGPFQGKPACVRIAMGRGVCGTAAVTRHTQVVADVNEFPGHIACDPVSRSELVVPLLRPDGTLLGVWDVDSAEQGRFDAIDKVGMEGLCRAFMGSLGN